MTLDPKIREKLLNESRKPFQGLRRIIWIALSVSAFTGLFIMTIRLFAGEPVEVNDFVVQLTALLIFSVLIFFDRSKPSS